MKNIRFNLNSKAISILIMICGIAIFSLSLIIAETSSTVLIFIKRILEAIGPTFISAGCVSLLLEISTIQKCVEDAILNLMQGNFPMEAFSSDVIKKIKAKSVQALSPDKKIDETAYSLEPYLLGQMNKSYYDYHECKYVLYPDFENKKIKKIVSLKGILCKGAETTSSYEYKWLFKREEGITAKNFSDFVKITKFKVFKENRTQDAKKKLNFSESENKFDEYPFCISFYWDFSDYSRVEFEFEYEYCVTMEDLSQTFKLMKPCRKLKHTILIEGTNSDEIRLSASAFAAFNTTGQPSEKKYCANLLTHHTCTVNFDAWALPGAGYVVNLVRSM